MALTTVNSLSEMYSGNVSSAMNVAFIQPAEKTPSTDSPDVNLGKEAEGTMDDSKEVDV